MAASGENTLLMMETLKSIVSPGGELGGRKHRWRGDNEVVRVEKDSRASYSEDEKESEREAKKR